MASQRARALPPGPAGGTTHQEQQLSELLRRIDGAQQQIDEIFTVLRDLAIAVRDRPGQRLDPRSRSAAPVPRTNGNGNGGYGGMRGWGH